MRLSEYLKFTIIFFKFSLIFEIIFAYIIIYNNEVFKMLVRCLVKTLLYFISQFLQFSLWIEHGQKRKKFK